MYHRLFAPFSNHVRFGGQTFRRRTTGRPPARAVSVRFRADDDNGTEMPEGGLSAPLPDSRRKPSTAALGGSYTPSPCRTVGLKRRSAGSSSLHPNSSTKKTKTTGETTRKRVEFGGGTANAEDGGTGPVPTSGDLGGASPTPVTVLEKRREIERLKSELKNCEQVGTLSL